jgi:transposase
VAVTNGELYTIITNKAAHGKQGCLVAIIKGTKAEVIIPVLMRIPREYRLKVIEITRDLAENMELIAQNCFPNAVHILDRFHVQQLVSDALQEVRLVLRRQAMQEHNEKAKEAMAQGKKHRSKRFENGDTTKELLARSRHLLSKSSSKWTTSQEERAAILFREFPDLQKAYELTMLFRSVYECNQGKHVARERLQQWYQKVEKYQECFPQFLTPAETVQLNEEDILRYLESGATNAGAESFNAKIKGFRALQRGVRDVSFFLYRVSKLYGESH